MKWFVFLALVAWECQAGPRVPDSINFVSGSPLNSPDGPTGGFGDVAANVLAALETKAQKPATIVRLIVTSLDERRDPVVPTTNEILRTMIPTLNPDRRYRAQIFHGVEFFFTDPKYATVEQLQASVGFNRPPLPDLTMDDLAIFRSRIPRAELAIQLSANANPAQILKVLAPIALSVGEFHPSSSLVSGWLRAGRTTADASPVLLLNAGAGALGVYLVQPRKPELHQQVLKKHFGIKSPSHFLFAYSNEDKAAQLYVDALSIALKNDRRLFQLVVRNPKKLNLKQLPSNVKVRAGQSLPHNVVEALIACSVVSPLISGDVSQSLGMSYASGTKSFVLEVPSWAEGHSEVLKKQLSQGGNADYQAFVESFFLVDDEIGGISRSSGEWSRRAAQLATALVHERFNLQLVDSINKRKSSWNLLDNLWRIHELLNQMDFTTLKNPPPQLLNFAIFHRLAGGANGVDRELKRVALNQDLNATERNFALWLLLNQNVRLSGALWQAAMDSLLDFQTPQFDPWTVLSPRLPRAKWVDLNSRLNQRYIAGELTQFQFWRAKLSLPVEVIRSEREVVNYLTAIKRYFAHPVRMQLQVKAGKGSIPTSTDALRKLALLERLSEIDSEQFYAASAWAAGRKHFPLVGVLQTHNRIAKQSPLSPTSERNLLQVLRSLLRENYDPNTWGDAIAEAVPALKSLAPGKIGLELIEKVIRIKSLYGDSKPQACEIAASYYESAPHLGRKTLATLLGTCLVDLSEDQPEFDVVLAFLRTKLPQDQVLWDALIDVMQVDLLELWAPEKLATLLIDLADEQANLIEPILPSLVRASKLDFKGFPQRARSLVKSLGHNPCFHALLKSAKK